MILRFSWRDIRIALLLPKINNENEFALYLADNSFLRWEDKGY